MEFLLLGPLEVRDQGRSLALGTPRTRAVLGILLTRPGRLVSVDTFIDELWPDTPPRDARALVHGYISRLRRVLRQGAPPEQAGPVLTRKPGYLLRLDAAQHGTDRCDVADFEELIEHARARRDSGDHSAAVTQFRRAHRLWRGEPFADVPSTASIGAAVTRLTEMRLGTLEEQFDTALRAGDAAELVAELTELVCAHPLRERLTGHLMTALYRSGQAASALETYRRAEARLRDELGIDPGAELRRLRAAIRLPHAGRHLPAASVPQPAVASTAVPAWPDHIRPAQLPADRASFTGRAAELADLLQAPEAGSDAVIVDAVDGMAGIGKTALVVHAAHRLAERFPDGQLFIDLHGFTHDVPPVEPADALGRMLRDLGVPTMRIPHHTEERAALFRSLVADRRILLVLDNAGSEDQVRPLLPGGRGCLVLVTSRRRLAGLDDARQVSVDVLAPHEAVALFIRTVGERRIAADELRRVTDVVALCGHLPLAIRIAGSRLRARPGWTLDDLAERLGDARDRLRELEAGQRDVTTAFQVSYHHLPTDQRRMFRLLGLHPGTDLDAHAAAALAQVTPREARRLLEELVDVHLLQSARNGRYTFHDLIRTHAARTAICDEPEADRVAASGALFAYYTATVAMATGKLYPRADGPRGSDARGDSATGASDGKPSIVDAAGAGRWLDTEMANILAVAAMAARADSPDQSVPLRLSAVLVRHFNNRSRHHDALTLYALALQVASGDDRATVARIHTDMGGVYWRLGEFDNAITHLRQALGHVDGSDDTAGAARVHGMLGNVLLFRGRHHRALRHLRQALAHFEEAGDRAGAARSIGNLGIVYQRLGRYDQAGAHIRDATARCHELGNAAGEAVGLVNLGCLHRRLGDYNRALGFLHAAESLLQDSPRPATHAGLQAEYGYVRGMMGQFRRAFEHYDRAIGHFREAGESRALSAALNESAHVLRRAQRHDEAISRSSEALAIARRQGDRYEQARAQDGLGRAHLALADLSTARRHWEQALSHYQECDVPDAEDVRAALSRLGRTAVTPG